MKLVFNTLTLAATLALLCAGPARADTTVITFEDLVEGALLSTQYSALGVTFSANAFSGAGSSSSTQPWAGNTDMTITATDLGGLGSPPLVSGKMLHSFNGWVAEDGDASFWINFSAPVGSVSMDFAGISKASDVRLFAYNGTSLLGVVSATALTGQQTLSFSAAAITKVAVAPGSHDDWVGVDNIKFAPAAAVPEPTSHALMAIGLMALLAKRRGCGSRM
ncbi:PEP-CTERM sorting domain-containing protein [Roseateles oligotrophus]|uniref:PEP-CTERM sorting domain-containing protein n=1 Tax=Roseateles oligotrophus TaxID=1769250 RepID=A0ABT2YCU0_9BURK|nr:PEP-CTERM sorting domain-containing protein [Roseateles oligotrophus]MCV2367858.1 PEP-CTERM sorting domain-containing protein [Roseateles oligotrophus]